MPIEILNHSERLFRTLVEHSLDALTLMTADGTVTYANAATERISGYSVTEFVGTNAFTLVHPADLAGVQSLYTDLLAHPGESATFTYRLRHKDGTWRWMEATIRNLLHDPVTNALFSTARDITERKQAEEEQTLLLAREQVARKDVEMAQAHLYELFMQAPANIAIMHGPERHFVLANPRFLQAIGRTDVLGKPASTVLPEMAMQQYSALIEEVYTTGIPFVGKEMAVEIDRRGDGTLEENFYNFVFQPFHNARGETEGIMLHGVDVTEQVLARRRVEELVSELQTEREALRRTEQESVERAAQLSAIFEAMNDGIIVCGPEGNILRINPTVRDSTGVAQDAFQGMPQGIPTIDWLIPRDLTGVPLIRDQWPLMRALRGEQVSGRNTVDLLFSDSEGKDMLLNCSAAPMYDARGQIIGAVAVLRDVTERIQLERRLQYSERKLLSLVDANILGVAVADDQGKIREANDLLVQTLGYSREEMRAETFHWHTHLTPPELREEEMRIVQTLIATGTMSPWEREYIRKDGSRIPALVTATMIDQEEHLALVVSLDISDRKAAEQRKEEFLGMVSHELRTPLTGIVGYLDLASFHVQQLPRNLSPAIDDLVGKIEMMIQHAEQQAGIEDRLIEALLDVSRMEQHTFELSLAQRNLLTIVESVVRSQQQIAGTHRLQLTLTTHESIPVIVDADRVGQVLINYITNALKYSPADFEVTVGLEVLATSARVFVRDQGPGLTAEQQMRVWERFYRTGTPVSQGMGKEGLGLGLYISRIIIEQHHGQVGVESTPGVGSTFWFTLPLASTSAETAQADT